jgi:hypothetical protein
VGAVSAQLFNGYVVGVDDDDDYDRRRWEGRRWSVIMVKEGGREMA